MDTDLQATLRAAIIRLFSTGARLAKEDSGGADLYEHVQIMRHLFYVTEQQNEQLLAKRLEDIGISFSQHPDLIRVYFTREFHVKFLQFVLDKKILNALEVDSMPWHEIKSLVLPILFCPQATESSTVKLKGSPLLVDSFLVLASKLKISARESQLWVRLYLSLWLKMLKSPDIFARLSDQCSLAEWSDIVRVLCKLPDQISSFVYEADKDLKWLQHFQASSYFTRIASLLVRDLLSESDESLSHDTILRAEEVVRTLIMLGGLQQLVLVFKEHLKIKSNALCSLMGRLSPHLTMKIMAQLFRMVFQSNDIQGGVSSSLKISSYHYRHRSQTMCLLISLLAKCFI